jgi:hypothetical protein
MAFGRFEKGLAIACAAFVILVVAFIAARGSGSGPAGPALPAATAPSEGESPRPAAAGQLDEGSFWGLVESTRRAAGNDTERQSELLEERLSRLPAQAILDFQSIRHRLDEQAYTWDLWGAAYVIEDGCSEDCFRDFRRYLISLGRGPYEAALHDPDFLAPIVQDEEQGDWENADSVTGDAYESATGEDIPVEDSDLSGNPRGDAWDDENQDELVRRYPKLAARFR